MTKDLKLFNGRLRGYERGYIAAYSQADAVRVASEVFGPRGWQSEIRDYWNKGLWGNAMIGVTPRRGMFAQKKDDSLVEFVGRNKTVPLERDDPQAWDAHQAEGNVRRDAAEAERQRAYQEKRERIFRVWQLLEKQREFALIQQMVTQDFCEFDYDGHRYRIEEIEE